MRDEAASAAAASDVAGIIVSLGTERESAPRIAAYVWGPVPTGDKTAASIAA
jgi:hypothetical protein